MAPTSRAKSAVATSLFGVSDRRDRCKSGAKIALILGEQELNEKAITIKMLRENVPQERISQDDLVQYLQKLSR